jgi:hypothetical protein
MRDHKQCQARPSTPERLLPPSIDESMKRGSRAHATLLTAFPPRSRGRRHQLHAAGTAHRRFSPSWSALALVFTTNTYDSSWATNSCVAVERERRGPPRPSQRQTSNHSEFSRRDSPVLRHHRNMHRLAHPQSFLMLQRHVVFAHCPCRALLNLFSFLYT